MRNGLRSSAYLENALMFASTSSRVATRLTQYPKLSDCAATFLPFCIDYTTSEYKRHLDSLLEQETLFLFAHFPSARLQPIVADDSKRTVANVTKIKRQKKNRLVNMAFPLG